MQRRQVEKRIHEKKQIRAAIHEFRKFIGRDKPDSEYDKFLYKHAYNIAGTLHRLEKEFRGTLSRAELGVVYAYVLEKLFVESAKPEAHHFNLGLAPFLATRGVIAYLKKFRKFRKENEGEISRAMREVRNDFWSHHHGRIDPNDKFSEYLHKYYINYLETKTNRANIILFTKLSTARYFADQFAKSELTPLAENIRK